MNHTWAATGSVGERGRHGPIRTCHSARYLLILMATGLLILTLALRGATPTRSSDDQARIAGPVAWLLAASSDLGPARGRQISVTAALHHSARPQTLFGWAADRHLTVRWNPGADWAYIEGAPADLFISTE